MDLSLDLSPHEPLPANPRVHNEGREYYERNIKSFDLFSHGKEAVDSKPEFRLRSDTARDIAMKNRGSVQTNLQGYADPPIVRSIHPRGVRPEARNIAAGNKGINLRNLIDNYGRLELSPRPHAKVKGSEAEEYKEREQGSTKILLNHFSTDPIPASELPPPMRLGLGAEEIAEKHRGERMGPVLRLEGTKTPREPKVSRLHQESTGSGWDEDPPHLRRRPEGKGIAEKNSADSIGEIILQNLHLIAPQTKKSKILKHLEESPIPSNLPIHRVRLDGVQNLEKAMNQTDMSAIMHGIPKMSSRHRPCAETEMSTIMHGNPTVSGGSQVNSNIKVLPHMRNSELW